MIDIQRLLNIILYKQVTYINSCGQIKSPSFLFIFWFKNQKFIII